MPTRIAFAHAARLPASLCVQPLRPARSHQLKALPVALVAAAGLSFGLAGTAAHAATIVVNNGADTSGAGICTLRDAFYSMQQQQPGSATNGVVGCTVASGTFGTADTITFANTVTGVSLTQSNPLNMYGSFMSPPLLVQGRGHGGVTISRPAFQNTLIQQYGGDLTLDGITLTGGQSSFGGAVDMDANGNGAANKFQLKNSVVTGNHATSAGAGIYVNSSAGVIAAVTITNSTVSNNQAFGGGVNGAGIYLAGPSLLTMTGSTVSGNGSSGPAVNGGGIFASGTATVTLTNSTVSGNTSYCQGSGLYSAISASNAAASVTLTNVTFTANNIPGECGGASGLFQGGGNITLNNTVLADNTSSFGASDVGSDTALNVTGSNNLARNFTANVTFTNAPLTSDPLLGPLTNNGGVTFTHALLSGSPAINAGSSTSPLTTDQRGTGFPRLSGSAVDIGAYEFISIVNGVCGSASSSTPVLAAPTSNLCSAGTATAVSGPSPSNFTWGCNGSGGGTSTSATACSVPIRTWSVTPSVATGAGSGSISPANTVAINNNATSTFTLTPAAGYTTTSVTGCNGTLSGGGTSYTTGAVTASCNVIASFALTPINGACGSASGAAPALVAPSANLCSTGTATAVSGTGPWTWGCNGNATGSSTAATACSVAIKNWTVTPSVSGGNGAIAPSTAVTVNNNAATSFTVTPSSGYNIASVIGCGGTRNGALFSIVAVTADCSVVAMFSVAPRALVTISGNATTIPNGASVPVVLNGTDFGARLVGQSVTNSFVLANNGNTTYTINGMSFTGTNAADFTITSPTTFPVIVNAGASTTFSVRFTPSAAGQRSAALVIALNDGLPSGAVTDSHLKALVTAGFAVQGVGVQAIPESLPVPAWGLGGLMASLLGLLLTGFAALRRSGKR